MRLLIATGLYPPEIGGPATYAKLFEDRLPAYGIEVSVLPFRIVRRFPPLIRHIVYAVRLALKARAADVILVQDTVSTGLPAAIVSVLLRKKLVVRVPGDYAWEQGRQRFGVEDSLDEFQKKSYGIRVGLLRTIQRFVVARATRIVVPSAYLGRIVESWFKEQKEVTLIYNGIEITDVTTDERKRNSIVSAGRLVPWKGFESVVDVMGRHPEWELTIYGDGPLRTHLTDYIFKSTGKERMHLNTTTSHDELQHVFRNASVFVLNSHYEGLSHTLIEAMAAGCAVIATRVGGNPEVVTDEENGLLIQPGNIRDLERALINVLGDTDKREALQKAAAERAKDFSIEKTVDETAKLLKNLSA